MISPQHQLLSEPILRGRLQDLDVGSLLSALQLGRQYLTLEVYDAAGECTGVVAVKAGRIISASVDGYTGNEAVRRLIQRREAAEFRVLLQPTAADMEDEPLDTVAMISHALSESEVRTLPARTRILEGVLSEHLRFEDILRSVSSSRQLLALSLSAATGRTIGEVVVKANQVLSARAGDLLELPALLQLHRAPAGSHFVLFAESHSVTELPPLGTVAELLSRAKQAAAQLQSPSSNGVHKVLSRTLHGVQSPPEPKPETFGRILEGSLDEFELSHVLKVLSTSRQHFELQVQDITAGTTVGVIEVKSGVILAASTDNLIGLSAAHELLRTQKGRFVAIRRADRSLTEPALSSVTELLQPSAAAQDLESNQGFEEESPTLTLSRAAEQSAPDNAGRSPIPVMDGKLGDLDVSSILRVAGASRQYTCVHIFDDQRRPLGVIHLKGGQVVSAQAQDVIGVHAVRRLLHCPRDFSFLVQRYPNAAEVKTSIGSIASVLNRAAGQSSQSGTAAAAQTGATSVTQHPSGMSLSKRRDAPSSTWMGGAVLGAGFVLLGGIATAIVLRSPALNTSVSPMLVAPAPLPQPETEPADSTPRPAVQPEAAPVAPAGPAPIETGQEGPPDPAALSRATIASLQAGLHQLGYETGPIDGVIGPRTAAAIKAFQYAEHLTVDGTISAPTRAVLMRRISEP